MRRWMVAGTAAGLMVAVTIALSGVRSETAVGDVPSPGFLAAAVGTQENLAEGRIELRCEARNEGAPEFPAEVYHYIRTPEVSWVCREAGAWRHVASYDRVTEEYRQLSAVTTNGKEEVRAVSDHRLPLGPAHNQNIPDLALFPWGDGGQSLPDTIAQGVVQAGQEDIVGHKCWRVDIVGKRTGPADMRQASAWLDPESRLLPRRVVKTRNDGLVATIDFADYQEIGDGVMIPMHMSRQFSQDGRPEAPERITVLDAKAGEAGVGEDLRIKFPEGVVVMQRDTGVQPGAQVGQ